MVPRSTASPEYITQIRSQVSSTRPRLWLMNSIEVPYFLPRSLTSSTTAASTVTSSAVVGSSRISSAGSRHQRHGDDDALLLAARELVRIGVQDPRRDRAA